MDDPLPANSQPGDPSRNKAEDWAQLARQIKAWGQELGFQQLGISGIQLDEAEANLQAWLDKGYAGEMGFMARHGSKRTRPAELEPGTLSVICVRMDYFPTEASQAEAVLQDSTKAYISRYALGRDYHKVLRQRLQRLADKIQQAAGPFGYRVFTDSAPVMEKPLAEKAGLGWIGKHTNLLAEQTGSWFFLGEIYTDLPLPTDTPADNHCGTCQACIDSCPTQAIVAPYELDARLCISYLTIELRGPIPVQLRPLIGNRIYGCDDCQLACPWNRFTQETKEPDFRPRHQLDDISLIECFSWSEETFLSNMEGSAIRRIGYECWLRNIAVALGNMGLNGKVDEGIREAAVRALVARQEDSSELVREHVVWALNQLHSTK